ncbi:aminotransferase class V-fold PLP-dependent enzyme [Paraburkholderia dilworthii]|uniref:aminotransferase class V-fold PLP-dependent enzyme n=1 Tax=Paraburkholderia dilworthii TaxID=948106 RepID=UPI001FCC0833|nr:aminotransferase class V-fold PLP-dependent enzyme [Paraburkholderia dilworthii]
MLELDREGFGVIVLSVQESGLVGLAVFKAALQPGAVFASVMFVDKETRVIQDIAAIGRAREILLRVDAAHAADKIPIDLAALPVDLMSFPRSQDLRPQGHWRAVRGARPLMRIGCQLHGGVHASVRQGTAIAPVEIHCSILAETRSRRPCLTVARARRFQAQQPTTCNSPSNRPARLTRSKAIQA